MNKLFCILISLVAGCDVSESTRQDLLACTSQNGANRAVFYRLYGGGAAGWQTMHVSVQTGNSQPVVVLTMSHGYDVELAWQENSMLAIVYPDSATVIESKTSFGSGVVHLQAQSSATGSFNGGSQCVVAQQGATAEPPLDARAGVG